MFEDALEAARECFSPPFRRVLFKTLGVTVGLLALAFVGLMRLLTSYDPLSAPGLQAAVAILGGVGLFVSLGFLLTPVSFVVAGFFFDELAETVERDLEPDECTGRPLPVHDSLRIALRFSAVSVVVNLIALVLWLIPGLNALIFFTANAYLSGRGYFELAASRFLPYRQVEQLRRAHSLRLFIAGLFVAAVVSIPFLNLLTPLFGTAFFVRVARRIMRKPAAAPQNRMRGVPSSRGRGRGGPGR